MKSLINYEKKHYIFFHAKIIKFIYLKIITMEYNCVCLFNLCIYH